MKRIKLSITIIIFILINIGFQSADAQQLKPYIQTEAGISLEVKDVMHLGVEFGESYKWFDFGLSLNYEGNSLGKSYIESTNLLYDDQNYNDLIWVKNNFGYFSYTSLQLICKVDIVHIFTTNSHHSFKLGGGYGIVQHKYSNRKVNDSQTPASYSMIVGSGVGLSSSFLVDYEYIFNNNFKVGVFLGGTEYPSIGLLLRKDF